MGTGGAVEGWELQLLRQEGQGLAGQAGGFGGDVEDDAPAGFEVRGPLAESGDGVPQKHERGGAGDNVGLEGDGVVFEFRDVVLEECDICSCLARFPPCLLEHTA